MPDTKPGSSRCHMVQEFAVEQKVSWHVTLRRTVVTEGVILVALLMVVIALWIPFGFNVGFLGDDWFFYMNARYGTAWATLGRPFLPIPFILGYALVPGQFAGFNLILALILFARAGLCYAILSQLGSGKAVAFAVAVLTSVTPIDTGVFYMGAIAVYFTWVAYLFAVYMLLLYWQQPKTIFVAGMWCAQVLCLGIYEAGYPLILFTPLALLILKGSGNWRGTLVRWYLFPVLNLVRLVVTALVNPAALNYQASLTRQIPSIADMIGSLARSYSRHFFTAWFGEPINTAYLVLAVALGGAVAAVCWWLARQGLPKRDRLSVVFLVAGLAIVGLGVAVYLPTSVRNDTVRTYFASSIGAALALVSLIGLLARRPVSFALAVGLVVGLGFSLLLSQHEDLGQQSRVQQDFLRQVAAQAPAVKPYTALLVMDETEDHELTDVFWNRWHFENPFMVMYDEPTMAVALCYPDDKPDDTEAFCAFGADAVQARISPLIVWERPYNTVILFRYTRDRELILSSDLAPYGSNALYQPTAQIDDERQPTELMRAIVAAPS